MSSGLSRELTGVIANIQRFSLHDGPGARSTVFFKGCPLRCFWCHNPEMYEYGPQLRYKRADCVFCGSCVAACPRGALRISPGDGSERGDADRDGGNGDGVKHDNGEHGDCDNGERGDSERIDGGEHNDDGERNNADRGDDGERGDRDPRSFGHGDGGGHSGRVDGGARLVYDRRACDLCFACRDDCPTGALAVNGQIMTVEEVVLECARDITMYERTGGGVTLSGGEASGQYDFASALIDALKADGIHIALDTCGLCPRDRLLELASRVDLTLYDIKHADPGAHREITGSDNSLILANLRALGACLPETLIEVRIPVIPGYNDDTANISAIAAILAGNPGVKSAVLLGYHPLGQSKIFDFDRQSAQMNLTPPGRARMNELAELVRSIAGLPVSWR